MLVIGSDRNLELISIQLKTEVLASKNDVIDRVKPGSSPIKGIRKRPLWVYVLKTVIGGKGLVVKRKSLKFIYGVVEVGAHAQPS